MRTALYEKPEGCAYALYDLGIETGEWESKGQLVFTSDSEAKLRQVLESDPESVMQLFTDSEEGIFTKINNIMDDTAKISSGSPGALVELAGVKGKASESNNTLYEQIKDIDDRIAALKETYEREKNRYWSEFNTMEQLISNMNVQSRGCRSSSARCNGRKVKEYGAQSISEISAAVGDDNDSG